MLSRIVLAALVAGLLAGAFATAAQTVRVIPLILAAEAYEDKDTHSEEAHAEHAEAKGHLTGVDAARIASRAGVGRAVLVHISPRYNSDELSLLEEAAKSRFEGAEMGEDFRVYQVPLPDDDESAGS